MSPAEDENVIEALPSSLFAVETAFLKTLYVPGPVVVLSLVARPYERCLTKGAS